MRPRQRQRGMSIPGMLLIAIMVGFFIMAAIRLTPPYFEYLSIRDIVQQVALETNPESHSTGQIRRKIGTMFSTNQIYGLKAEDIEIYRKNGKTYIDAGYTVQVPMVGRIDALVKFDDIIYIVGVGAPVSQPPNK